MNASTFKSAKYSLLEMIKEVLEGSERDITNLTIESKYQGNVHSIAWTESVIAVKNKRKQSRSSDMNIKTHLVNETPVFYLVRNGQNATEDFTMAQMITYLNQYY